MLTYTSFLKMMQMMTKLPMIFLKTSLAITLNLMKCTNMST